MRHTNKHAQHHRQHYDLRVPSGYMLVFYKAKTFGVHTEVYRLPIGLDMNGLRGRRLTFTWEKDG